MKTKLVKRLVFVALLFSILAHGQCPPSVPTSPLCANCTPLTQTQLQNNQTLAAGTYCVTGSVSNLRAPAGVIICLSSGSINGLDLQGGNLIYNSGSIQNLTQNNSASTIFVRGGFTLPTSGLIASVVVESGGTLTVNGDVSLNSNSGRRQYSWTDGEPVKGTSYYRLKQVDTDGRVYYFKIISVVLDGLSHVYPNPVSSQLTVALRTEQTGDVTGWRMN